MRLFVKYMLITYFICNALGCGLFRRNATLKQEAASYDKKVQQLSKRDQSYKNDQLQYLLLNKDSLRSVYQLQVWPKGKVSFDMFNGFAGEFDSVRMTAFEERTNLRKQSIDQNNSKKLDRTEDLVIDSIGTVLNKSNMKKNIPDFLWIIISIIILITVAFFTLKRFI